MQSCCKNFLVCESKLPAGYLGSAAVISHGMLVGLIMGSAEAIRHRHEMLEPLWSQEVNVKRILVDCKCNCAVDHKFDNPAAIFLVADYLTRHSILP